MMNWKPTRKVAAGGFGSGAFGVPLGVLLAGHLGLGPEESAALGALLTAFFGFVAAWLMPEGAPAMAPMPDAAPTLDTALDDAPGARLGNID